MMDESERRLQLLQPIRRRTDLSICGYYARKPARVAYPPTSTLDRNQYYLRTILETTKARASRRVCNTQYNCTSDEAVT